MRFRKKEGAVQVMAICLIGLAIIFFWLLLGLTQIQTEYVTARLNECVSEAILSADFIDQHAMSTYGYTILDCSEPEVPHCAHNSCAYGSADMEEAEAYAQSYYKAWARLENSIKTSLALGNDLSPTEDTPCNIMKVDVEDFCVYNVIGYTGKDILSEGKTYMCGMKEKGWYDAGQTITAPNGESVQVSGIYVDIRFKIKTFMANTATIPVRVFVGITQ